MQTLIDLILGAFKRSGDPVVVNFAPVPAWQKGQDGYVAVREGYTIAKAPQSGVPMPRRLHVFEDTKTFGAFLLRHFNPATTEILGNRKDGIVAASGCIHGRDVIKCSLARTSVSEAWQEALQETFDQRKLYRLLRSYQDYIVGDAGALLAGLRSLEVLGTSEVKGNLTANGVYEFVGASQGTNIKGHLPTDFKIAFQVYRGHENVPVGLELTLDMEIVPQIIPGRAPTFTLEARNWEEVLDTAFNGELRMLDYLINQEPTTQDASNPWCKFLIGRGTASFTDTWA